MSTPTTKQAKATPPPTDKLENALEALTVAIESLADLRVLFGAIAKEVEYKSNAYRLATTGTYLADDWLELAEHGITELQKAEGVTL